MKNQFDLDLQVAKDEVAPKEVQPASGLICTPSCLTGTLNCKVSLTFCRTC
ncbi:MULTISPECIES: FDLD family class I lanthipeptide [Paenibacillus]|uniref:Subtilin lantibiotic n=1 Tax=Paenibacillus campinasensis TaxID=66347 RepID=A0A268EJT7_9BACL|nr:MULTISPECIES: FDLD family class I lanthipeptide [Paenibacillus]PAD73396.1 subtilin lantibiotic [Paenibacillus campinasensis]PAK51186.1 subtilin lantibiotic [Paenibacillus sp. 7541]